MTSRSPDRLRRRLWIAVAVAVIVVSATLLGAQRLTRADRERLVIAYEAHLDADTRDVADDTPSHYYLDMEPFAERLEAGEFADPPLDEDGVPQVFYKGTGTLEHNPVTTAQYGLALFGRYLEGDGEALDGATAAADRLIEVMDDEGRLPYEFAIASRRLEPPWYSAMAQGQAISLLVRCAEATGEERYVEAANRAFQPFLAEVPEGVVLEGYGELWLEEYPDEPPSHVLNGALFAAFGLWDLARVTDDPKVEDVFERASATLAAHLGEYERDGWVLYQLSGENYAGTYYSLHIEQLDVMSAISGDGTFAEYAARWEGPLDNEGVFLARQALMRARRLVRESLGS